MSKYPSIAHGGVPAAQAHGAVRSAGHGTSDLRLSLGGADWVDAPVMCVYPQKSTGWPCEHEALEGRDHCLGHSRTAAKANQQTGS